MLPAAVAGAGLAFALFCMAMPWGEVIVGGEVVSELTGNDLAVGASLPWEMMPEAAQETAEGREALAALEATLNQISALLWLPYVGAVLALGLLVLARFRARSRVLFLNLAAFAALGVALAAPLHSLMIVDLFRDFFTIYAEHLGRFVERGLASEAEANALLGTGIVGPGWGFACSAGGALAAIAFAAGARLSKGERELGGP